MRAAGGAQPLSPKRKWQTITVATLLLIPAFWALLAGMVSAARDHPADGPDAAAALAFGLSVIPFVFVVVAFLSGHPRAPMAVLGAMGLCLAVGVPVSMAAGDAVTGVVAGIGAGGIVALRPEPSYGWKPRAVAVAVATAYTFVLVRTVAELALLSVPVFPLTAIGLADHVVDRREEREERERQRRSLAGN